MIFRKGTALFWFWLVFGGLLVTSAYFASQVDARRGAAIAHRATGMP